MPEYFGAGRGCDFGAELDRHCHAMDAGRRTGVDDLSLGNGAVRDDRQVARCGEDVSRTPPHLDNATLSGAVDADPITRPIRPTKTQDDAENTSFNVLCSANPRTIAMAPEVATSPLIGKSKT
jgi:hypothetical protein